MKTVTLKYDIGVDVYCIVYDNDSYTIYIDTIEIYEVTENGVEIKCKNLESVNSSMVFDTMETACDKLINLNKERLKT